MSVDRAILIVPFGQDPLDALAAHLLAKHRPELPDLSRHTVLLPRASTARALHDALLRQVAVLLPPSVMPLEIWLERHAPLQPRLNPHQCELLFLSVLAEFPELKARYGAWPLIDGLLALFDELTLNIRTVPDAMSDFEAMLARGYGLPHATRLVPLSDEARLVHLLYRAWHDLLRQNETLDPAAAKIRAMQESLRLAEPSSHLYLVGVLDWPQAAFDWLTRLPCPVTVVLQGQTGGGAYHPDGAVSALVEQLDWPIDNPASDSPRTEYLNTVYALEGPALAQRAAAARLRFAVNPLADRIAIHVAADIEEEARAVELQIRRWWLADRRRLAVVSNDRKLLRRVRALLERAHLPVNDRSGWPLSTTSAATVLMDWLECVSRDFSREAVLDLLRSPFLSIRPDTALRRDAVAVLEQCLHAVRTMTPGLSGCERALVRYAAAHEESLDPVVVAAARQMLERLAQATTALAPLRSARALSLATFCRRLIKSLETLGVTDSYVADAAGNQLLGLLEELTQGAAASDAHGDWNECTHWLRRTLERRHFRPTFEGAGIELISLTDAALSHYDALVLAGCTDNHLPGVPERSPFFNDAVRHELGLPGLVEWNNIQFHLFRRLLEAGDTVLLTWRRYDANQPLVVAPWVERLAAFHTLAFGSDGADANLEALLREPKTVLAADDAALPAVATRPAPAIPAALLPERLTASLYQALVDCPYQFYARAVLGLEPPRPLEEELNPADFGRLAHRCLQAFHGGVEGLPGPWREPLTVETLPRAAALLEAIAEAVFAPHLRRTITTRAWLYRWRAVASDYLDWQMARARIWPVSRNEQSIERSLAVGERELRLYGRIDRLDQAGQAEAVIDYKSGLLPSHDDIAHGEHVQLPFYCLLAPAACEARLLGLQKDKIDDRTVIAGEALNTLTAGHSERLQALFGDIAHGAPLPAHGDAETCGRCAMATVCRQSLWDPQPE